MKIDLGKNSVFIIMLLFVLMGAVHSQGVYIGTNDTDPAASALLEAESTSQGVLIPRMTTAEIEAIINPVEGLMAYSTTADILCFFNGSTWMGVDGDSLTYTVGALAKGGVIFELDATLRHGKVSATADLNGGASYAWGCEGTDITSGNGATSTTDGLANTIAIITDCTTAGIAAKACNDYSVTVDGVLYDDWHLPSSSDLGTIYLQQLDIGGFDNLNYYQSSTETDANQNVAVSFVTSIETVVNKDDTSTLVVIIPGILEFTYEHLVRPIRNF